jgi:hypothetical protein
LFLNLTGLHGRFFIAAIFRRRLSGPERICMTRTNKKHGRNIQRHRRNQGPEMLSQAADNKLQKGADDIVQVLYKAATENCNLDAAGLLVDLAESAEYAEQLALQRKAQSWAERLEKEPQVAILDTALQLVGGGRRRLLTDGSSKHQPEEKVSSPPEVEEILDAEVG